MHVARQNPEGDGKLTCCRDWQGYVGTDEVSVPKLSRRARRTKPRSHDLVLCHSDPVGEGQTSWYPVRDKLVPNSDSPVDSSLSQPPPLLQVRGLSVARMVDPEA